MKSWFKKSAKFNIYTFSQARGVANPQRVLLRRVAPLRPQAEKQPGLRILLQEPQEHGLLTTGVPPVQDSLSILLPDCGVKFTSTGPKADGGMRVVPDRGSDTLFHTAKVKSDQSWEAVGVADQ